MSTDLSLERAIQALRNNDRETARDLLQQFTQAEPLRPEGWLWLAAAHDDPAQKRAYLQQVLALNPNEQRALAGLRALDQQAEPQIFSGAGGAVVRQLATEAISTPADTAESSDATTQATRLAQPRFVATGVRARRVIPWPIVALAAALVLLIPLALWLLGQTQGPQAVAGATTSLLIITHGWASPKIANIGLSEQYLPGSSERAS